MRLLRLLPLSLLLLTFAFADEWHKEYPLTGPPELRVETGDAHVRVVPWEKSSIDISLLTENWKIGPGDLQVTESQSGNRVEFSARSRNVHIGIGWERRKRADVVIHCPREGRFSLHTKDGRLEVRELKGDIDLRTEDGRLIGENLDGEIRAQTNDGRMELTGRFDGLDAHSSDGGVEVRALEGSKMKHEWALRTSDGSIRLALPKDFAAMLEAHTRDGHIDIDMPITMTVQGRVDPSNIRGRLNDGTYLLSLRSSDGSIHISN
jgi:hypothetical protein